MGMKPETYSDESQDEVMDEPLKTVDDILTEMRQMQRALSTRPAFEQVEAAKAAINRADKILISGLEELFSQTRPVGLPNPVFRAFQEMQEDVLRRQIQEQKRPWQAVIDLEDRHRHYNSLIQRVQAVIRSPSRTFSLLGTESKTNENHTDEFQKGLSSSFSSDDEAKDDWNHSTEGKFLYLETVDNRKPISQATPNSQFVAPYDSSKGTLNTARTNPFKSTAPIAPSSPLISSGLTSNRLSHSRSSSTSSALEPLSTIHEDGVKQQLPLELINLLEKAIETGSQVLDLSGTQFEGVVAFPESVGLLTSLTTLKLSGLQIELLPESIGALTNLVDLDLEGNKLTSLPESVGCLTSLEILNAEKNMIEELPWTIGNCSALKELTVGFNQLKGLPEAIGKLSHLRCLFVHLNSLMSLPTTMGNLKALEVLDAHFNQLDHIPESLCTLKSLRKLDLSSNFTELQELPDAIGNLHELRELNISYNHISVLPDSFANLSNLIKLELEGNPFRDPPFHVTQKGKEAVLEYMKEKVNSKERHGKQTMRKKTGFFGKLIFMVIHIFKRKSRKRADLLGLNIRA